MVRRITIISTPTYFNYQSAGCLYQDDYSNKDKTKICVFQYHESNEFKYVMYIGPGKTYLLSDSECNWTMNCLCYLECFPYIFVLLVLQHMLVSYTYFKNALSESRTSMYKLIAQLCLIHKRNLMSIVKLYYFCCLPTSFGDPNLGLASIRLVNYLVCV